MGPARPANGSADHCVEVAQPVHVGAAHVRGGGPFPDAAKHEARAGAEDEDPGAATIRRKLR